MFDVHVHRFNMYDDFGEKLESPETNPTNRRQLSASQENGDEVFYLRIKNMIAQDQVEQLLLENNQLRDEAKSVEDELRATIRIIEDRNNRWNSCQSERLRKKDEELRKYRQRLRELLALLRTRRNNSRMYLDSMIEMKEQANGLKDENDALKEENGKLVEEVDAMREQMTKYPYKVGYIGPILFTCLRTWQIILKTFTARTIIGSIAFFLLNLWTSVGQRLCQCLLSTWKKKSSSDNHKREF